MRSVRARAKKGEIKMKATIRGIEVKIKLHRYDDGDIGILISKIRGYFYPIGHFNQKDGILYLHSDIPADRGIRVTKTGNVKVKKI
jgi:hypothetical protein